MGIYLNPGNDEYLQAVNSQIYVDKTLLISFLNSVIKTEQKYVSVLRPRRFGKTITANMICAYYDKSVNSRSIFEHKKLGTCTFLTGNNPEWDKYLNQFDVLRLTMTDFINDYDNIEEMIASLQEEIITELIFAYPEVDYGKKRDLRNVMAKIYNITKNAFVIVIDEWDAIFREYPEDEHGQKKYLDFLRNWLKGKSYVALAYMTGILPIKKYGLHSALNMFDEYSMTSPMQLASYTGFTVEEVQLLCQQYGRNYHQIKEWYDGYEVSDIVPSDPGHQLLLSTGKKPEARKYSIYSPLSVVKAVTTGLIQNYWNATETYEALAEYINKNFDGLKDTVTFLMEGERVRINTRKYQNDMTSFQSKDDVLTMLVHLGYLGYDSVQNEVYIPNREVLDEFKNSTSGNDWDIIFRKLEKSEELLKATWKKDEEKVAGILEYFHSKSSKLHYNSEEDLSMAVRNAYYVADNYYLVVPELDTGKGFVDIAYIPLPKAIGKPAILVELKYEKSSNTAIDQIHKQEYPDRLEAYKGNLLLVAITYSKNKEKHHECIIEEA